MTDPLGNKLQVQPHPRATVFKPGHPKYGGRQKGTRNKLGGDLRQIIFDAINETGFVETVDGKRIATGEGGCKGFIKWLALNEPKTAAALLSRIMPYFIDTAEPAPVASLAEIEAEFRDMGLPMGLIAHLQAAPAPLDFDEDEDPYKTEVAQDDTTK